MDTTDPDIVFTEGGVCNHCIEYNNLMKNALSKENKRKILETTVNQIIKDGKGKDYDSVIGISGGVDSTYLAYKCKEFGLRPLAVHMDNGWNSELAIKNIENTVNKLDLDLYTEVLDWNEFKSLQKAFLYSSTPDIEIPTDHAIKATLYKIARKFKVKHILSGGNDVTESIHPKKWSHGHADWIYINHINNKFGTKKLKTYPHISYWELKFNKHIRGIQFHDLLNYMEYNKSDAIKILEDKLEWRNYESKHYESIYTRFFLGYILVKKFNYDKRRAHLSNLINSNQIDRESAITDIKEDPYPNENLLNDDHQFFLKKLDLTEEEFQKILDKPNKSFYDFPSNETSWKIKTFSKFAKWIGFKS